MVKLKIGILVMVVAMLVVGAAIVPSVTAGGVVNVYGYDYVASLDAGKTCVSVGAFCWGFDFASWRGFIKAIPKQVAARILTPACIAISSACVVEDALDEYDICKNAKLDGYFVKWWNVPGWHQPVKILVRCF